MPISNERMNQHIMDALRGLEVKGDTDAEGAPLREALTITDEMVERAAKAQYRLDWGLYLDENEWSSYRETYRAAARRVLEAALEVEK